MYVVIENLCGFMAVASLIMVLYGALNFTICRTYLFIFPPKGHCSSSLDPSAELSKLGELVLGTAEADKDDSAAPPDLQVDAPEDSPTEEPSQESSPGEVQGQGLVSQSSVSYYSHLSGEELERVRSRPRGSGPVQPYRTIHRGPSS